MYNWTQDTYTYICWPKAPSIAEVLKYSNARQLYRFMFLHHKTRAALFFFK